MVKNALYLVTLLLFIVSLSACAKKQPNITIRYDSVTPGTEVSKQGTKLSLSGTAIRIGQPLPKTALVETGSMKTIDLNDYKGNVLLISIVPSIDTKVCEAQTHYLGEEGDELPNTIKRITVSRDTPFAQARFAEEARLQDLTYLSDYKSGEFGRSTGLLIDGPELLARSIVLVDKQGIVRYIQVVPDITNLPDMEKAFSKARELNLM